MNKLTNKIAYVYLKTSIGLVYSLSYLITTLIRIIPIKKKYDVCVFVQAPLGADGYERRYAVFSPLFEEANIDFKLFTHLNEKELQDGINSPNPAKQYAVYRKIAWIRLRQIITSVRFKKVIIQRTLLPLYPDYKIPHFEKCLRKIHHSIYLDIWDPIHIWHPELTYASFKEVDALLVNTTALKECYNSRFNPLNIFVWPIAVDLNRYESTFNGAPPPPFKLFYTGAIGNFNNYFKPIIPILEKIGENYQIEIHVMSKGFADNNNLNIHYHQWDESKFKELVATCHIGLYPNFQKERTKSLTVAGKVLDYMASNLLIIGADQGIPEGISAENMMIVSNNIEDWEPKLHEVLKNYNQYKVKADFGYAFVCENLSIELQFEKLLLFLDIKK